MRAIAFTAFAGLFLVTLQSASFAQGMMPDAAKVSGGMLTEFQRNDALHLRQ